VLETMGCKQQGEGEGGRECRRRAKVKRETGNESAAQSVWTMELRWGDKSGLALSSETQSLAVRDGQGLRRPGPFGGDACALGSMNGHSRRSYLSKDDG
jgi:hypothetical protein